ncbi:hypothetical protein BGI40_07395 [Snodgrassella communis]|uniref:Beta-lactamase n=1 Tax=Snodgrassella communis TaxID=2946699 RepID=A0A066TQL6_9NEIS|nr:SEL1-like repeat protein [Snodgrassella communis]KDN13524.1 hypothetical protein SALWKB12_0379 [Snodgrassella communis]KDN15817.1 hypothetical protein SALWKB29_0236 [Snodgrassella communis]PIT12003.1 hypothetical protein BGI29_02895 [Snodgrassella communis]PIT28987.1 hypothetical protein BGI39_04410 [Snodgrassella communis]PIT29952.1 hypothetical protein BGI38_02325 [Snodgrassella communis]
MITQQDYAKAVKYYQLAAKQGYSYVIYNLGLMLYNGKGIKQDYQKAFQCFHQAAEDGLATALYNLGLMYFEGFSKQTEL